MLSTLVPHPSPEEPPAANCATAVPPPLFSLTGARGPLAVAAAEEATSLGHLCRVLGRAGVARGPSFLGPAQQLWLCLFLICFVCFISQIGI